MPHTIFIYRKNLYYIFTIFYIKFLTNICSFIFYFIFILGIEFFFKTLGILELVSVRYRRAKLYELYQNPENRILNSYM